jgi:hypothetical protein
MRIKMSAGEKRDLIIELIRRTIIPKLVIPSGAFGIHIENKNYYMNWLPDIRLVEFYVRKEGEKLLLGQIMMMEVNQFEQRRDSVAFLSVVKLAKPITLPQMGLTNELKHELILYEGGGWLYNSYQEFRSSEVRVQEELKQG